MVLNIKTGVTGRTLLLINPLCMPTDHVTLADPLHSVLKSGEWTPGKTCPRCPM